MVQGVLGLHLGKCQILCAADCTLGVKGAGFSSSITKSPTVCIYSGVYAWLAPWKISYGSFKI